MLKSVNLSNTSTLDKLTWNIKFFGRQPS